MVRFLSENLLLPLAEAGARDRPRAGAPRVTYDRSAVMRAVKSRDTTPERSVRALLRTIAPGYRLHRADLPGKPDIAYGRLRLAIFVHGCFWHGHDCAARRARAEDERRLLARQDRPQPRARRKVPGGAGRDGLAHARRLRVRAEGQAALKARLETAVRAA